MNAKLIFPLSTGGTDGESIDADLIREIRIEKPRLGNPPRPAPEANSYSVLASVEGRVLDEVMAMHMTFSDACLLGSLVANGIEQGEVVVIQELLDRMVSDAEHPDRIKY